MTRPKLRGSELAALLLLGLLFAVSGEREADLRARLEDERAFAESVAYESNAWAQALADERTLEQ